VYFAISYWIFVSFEKKRNHGNFPNSNRKKNHLITSKEFILDRIRWDIDRAEFNELKLLVPSAIKGLCRNRSFDEFFSEIKSILDVGG